MANFLIDTQLPPGLALRLVEHGHEAVHVNDVGLGAASDNIIAKEVIKRNAILVTKDEDFIVQSNLGRLDVPIIWIRFGNTTNRILWQRLAPILPDILTSLAGGEKIVEVV